jgi:outer membrane protein assembly factor BamB
MEEFEGHGFDEFSVEMGDFQVKKSKKFDRIVKAEPGGSVTTSVVYYEGLIYFGSANYNVYAVDPRDGKLVWKFRTEGSIMESTPTVDDGMVYIGSFDRNVYAIDSKSGKLVWKYETGEKVISHPVVSEGIVYCGSIDQNMYALDAKTGKLIWKFRTQDWIVSEALTVGEKLIFGSHDRYLYCLNKKTGKLLWKFRTQGEIYNDNVFPHREGVVYFGSFDNHLRAADIETGKLLWKKRLGNYGMAASGVIHGDMLIQPIRDGMLVALDFKGNVLWKFETTAEDAMGIPAVKDGLIYVGSYGSYNLYCLDMEGKELWRFKAFDGIYAAPFVFGKNVIFASWDCNVYCINRKTRNVVWKFRADGSPVVLPPPYEAFELETTIPKSSFDEARTKSYDLDIKDDSEESSSLYKSKITYQVSTQYAAKGKYQKDSAEEEF